MKLFYKGELCDETITNNLMFSMLILSFLYAMFLKIYNVIIVAWEELKVEGKLRDTTPEEILKDRYFYFYTY